MPSDRTRTSDDAAQQYRAVVTQQGRVTVDRDVNALQDIVNDAARAETLDVVGPAGTPDDGFKIDLPFAGPAQFDFGIAPGTMYVGGVRAAFAAAAGGAASGATVPISYFHQPDWLTPDPPPDKPVRELVYLHLAEQEVGAAEDDDLRDVALGGPDTTARVRLLQRVRRVAVPDATADCNAAWAEAVKQWGANGFDVDPKTMRLLPRATLQATFADTAAAADPCDPGGGGGYLGAENQCVRVQLSRPPGATATSLLWGFDNASTLFTVTAIGGTDRKKLTLAQAPVDAYHLPAAGTVVEVLKSAMRLPNGRWVAAASGFVTTLAEPYKDGAVVLADPLTGFDGLPDAKDPTKGAVFLRVWTARVPLTAGAATPLAGTGLTVTVAGGANGTLHGGDFWTIAVRPATPQRVYPDRFLSAPQPPDGPHQWVCPLALIGWTGTTGAVIKDCREPFDNLVKLTARQPPATPTPAAGGCCTVTVRADDLGEEKTLQAVIDAATEAGKGRAVTVCLLPGTYALREPLRLGPQHAGLTLEACQPGAVIRAGRTSGEGFLDGLVVLDRADGVTLRGLEFLLPRVGLLREVVRVLKGAPGAADPFIKVVGGVVGITPEVEVSVGVRPLACGRLTVRDCTFQFSAGAPPVFAAGVFAGGECRGLTVAGGRFVPDPADVFNAGAGGSPRLLAGVVASAAAVPPDDQQDGADRSSAAFLPAVLDAAAFRDNEFVGLTAAVLVVGEGGDVRFDGNAVRDGNVGFVWASRAALVEAMRSAGPVVLRPPRAGLFVSTAAVPNFDTFVKLALIYPLPATGDPPAGVVRAAALKLPALNDLGRLLREAAPLSLGRGGRIVVGKSIGNPPPMGVHACGNRADTARPVVPGDDQPPASGPALLALDADPDGTGGVVVTGNTFRTRSATPTAGVLLAPAQRSAVTGNLIANDLGGLQPALAKRAVSLVIEQRTSGAVDPANAPPPAHVAVAGNCFTGRTDLPTRPAGLDDWDTFNALNLA